MIFCKLQLRLISSLGVKFPSNFDFDELSHSSHSSSPVSLWAEAYNIAGQLQCNLNIIME